MTLIWGLQQLTMEDVEEGWTHVMEMVNALEEEKPSGRLGQAEAARYSREVALVRTRRELMTRRAEEEEKIRYAKEEEKIRLAQDDVGQTVDEFVFEAVNVQEVTEVVGEGRRVVWTQGEAPQKPSRNQRRRARKRQAEREEKRDLEEGRTTEEELVAGKARRKTEEEEKVTGKMVRGSHMARWEAKLEAMERRMKLQREEDATAWGLQVASLGAVIIEQRKDLEALRQEVAACYHRVPGRGRGARAGAAAGGRPADPRRAVPRAGPSPGNHPSRGNF